MSSFSPSKGAPSEENQSVNPIGTPLHPSQRTAVLEALEYFALGTAPGTVPELPVSQVYIQRRGLVLRPKLVSLPAGCLLLSSTPIPNPLFVSCPLRTQPSRQDTQHAAPIVSRSSSRHGDRNGSLRSVVCQRSSADDGDRRPPRMRDDPDSLSHVCVRVPLQRVREGR